MSDLQNLISTTAGTFVAGVNTAAKALTPLATPVINRLTQSGLFGALGVGRNNPSVKFYDSQPNADNWKVRIRISPDSPILYNAGKGILSPLVNTGGVIFPYTPQIQTTFQAIYTPQRFTHSNYTHYSYDNSEVQQINITADFTAQNQAEAQYVLACIYFFRAATKMFFGYDPSLAGNPPPIVFLNGYGQHYFPDVPCVITTFTHTMPSEVDYIVTNPSGYSIGENPVSIGSLGELGVNTDAGIASNGSAVDLASFNSTRIPTISSFSVSLQPVYSKASLTEFSLNDFAQGKLTSKRFI